MRQGWRMVDSSLVVSLSTETDGLTHTSTNVIWLIGFVGEAD